MIVHHEHRFVFVEIPLTGTTAIAKELREVYGGEEVLHKHAHFSEFRRGASVEEKRYRVFASVRHPLDRLVSYFTKLSNDHRGAFTDPARFVENGGWVTHADRERFAFIQEHGRDFGAYLRRFHVGARPAVSQYDWGKRRYARVIRFERLNEDFRAMLGDVGIEPQRDLPAANVTKGRERDFFDAYPQELRPEMKRVFGPLAAGWGYDFPGGWPGRVPVSARVQYAALNAVGRFVTEGLGLTPRHLQDLRAERARPRREDPAR